MMQKPTGVWKPVEKNSREMKRDDAKGKEKTKHTKKPVTTATTTTTQRAPESDKQDRLAQKQRGKRREAGGHETNNQPSSKK